jgi:site-specific recombinase XerD
MSAQPSSATSVLDAAGRRRSPATISGYHAGRAPKNKGLTYPADPPTVDEIIAVMRQAGDGPHGLRARGLIVVLWRAALRIQEALSLTESDLDPRRSSVLVRAGKGGHRREVGIDSWALNTGLCPWLELRATLPIGPLFCVIDGPTRGARPWSSAAVRAEFRRLAAQAGVRRRFAPHQLRHAHAVELAREGVPLPILQRQLGHRNMATTSIYLSGIGAEEVIAAVASRPAPMMSASAGLEL